MVRDQALKQMDDLDADDRLAVCCPITSNIKGYPFEVVVSGQKIKGAVFSDHLKNLDWKIRKAKFVEKASDDVVTQCSLKISVLLLQGSWVI